MFGSFFEFHGNRAGTRTIWHDDAFVSLLAAGAVAIGFAPIFVRLASTGPMRLLFGEWPSLCPFCGCFARRQNDGSSTLLHFRSPLVWLAGFAFALVGHLAHFDPTHSDECDLARQLRRVASADLLLVLFAGRSAPAR